MYNYASALTITSLSTHINVVSAKIIPLTDTANISFTDLILRHMDQSCLTGAVFISIDLYSAFDTVDHALLLDKLQGCGIVNSELAWFRYYLSNRTQVVSYQNQLSATCAIDTGVPQGAILGPLLFVLFINDLPDPVVCCNIISML